MFRRTLSVAMLGIMYITLLFTSFHQFDLVCVHSCLFLLYHLLFCQIRFYPARYHKFYNSIFALGEICDLITNESADVCILEEPEHLNWYRAPGK